MHLAMQFLSKKTLQVALRCHMPVQRVLKPAMSVPFRVGLSSKTCRERIQVKQSKGFQGQKSVKKGLN